MRRKCYETEPGTIALLLPAKSDCGSYLERFDGVPSEEPRRMSVRFQTGVYRGAHLSRAPQKALAFNAKRYDWVKKKFPTLPDGRARRG